MLNSVPTFDTSIEIQTPPDACWRVLTDTPRYPAWNLSVAVVAGELALGQRLILRLQLGGGRTMSTPVVVDVLEEGKALRWSSITAPLLLRVQHSFLLTPLAGGTRFRNVEVFSGPLAQLASPLLHRIMPSRYETYNRALKRYCEWDRRDAVLHQ